MSEVQVHTKDFSWWRLEAEVDEKVGGLDLAMATPRVICTKCGESVLGEPQAGRHVHITVDGVKELHKKIKHRPGCMLVWKETMPS